MNYTAVKHPIKKVFGISGLKAIFLVVSLVCFITLVFLEKREEYIGIVSLPFSFFLVALFMNFKKHLWGAGGLIIWAMYFLRYTIFPVFIVLGEYRCDADASVYLPYFNKACWLMNLELLCVSIVFCIVSSYILKKDKQITFSIALNISFNNELFEKKECNYGKRSYIRKVLYFISAALLLFNLAVYLLYPSLFRLYWQILFFEQDKLSRLEALNVLIEVIPGYIYYPFKLSAEFLKIIIITSLLIKFNNSNKIGNISKIILTGILMLLSLCLISSEQINSIILCFVIYVYVIYKNLKHSNVLVVIGCIAVLVGFIVVMQKIADVDSIQSLGRIINNYFSGPLNVACGIRLQDDIVLKESNIFTDIIKEIPLLQKMISGQSTNQLFNEIYDFHGAIMPLVSYGYVYYGYFGTALPAIVIAFTVLLLDKFVDNTRYEEYKLIFLYLTVHFSLAIGMYNLSIYYSLWIYELILPMVLYSISVLLGAGKYKMRGKSYE